jgi:hypothetical protein
MTLSPRQAQAVDPPQIQGSTSGTNDFVQGNGWVAGVAVDITIDPDGSPTFFDDATTPDGNGNFRFDLGMDLAPGDVVLVEQDPDGIPNEDDLSKDTI